MEYDILYLFYWVHREQYRDADDVGSCRFCGNSMGVESVVMGPPQGWKQMLWHSQGYVKEMFNDTFYCNGNITLSPVEEREAASNIF